MTEWDKFKVVELKEECKSRGISITGLKLKQQYIDKLAEYEAASQDTTQAEESVEDRTNGAFEEVEKDEVSEVVNESPRQHDNSNVQRSESNKDDTDDVVIQDIPLAIEADENLPSDRPAALKVEDSRDADIEPEEDIPMADTAQEAKDIIKDDILIPEPAQIQVTNDKGLAQDLPIKGQEAEDSLTAGPEENDLEQLNKEPTPTPIVDEPDVVVEETSLPKDELRKRKRRSATPPPNEQEIRKKAKGENGDAVLRTDTRSPEIDPQGRARQQRSTSEEKKAQTKETIRDVKPRSPTPVIDDDKMTEPAMHAATQSLYMRNFKRPLNVPTLRSHVLTIAQGASSVAPGEDAIKFWYMNNIRSHAFVTFTSISAASRVRAAMHQTRFPEEPQREPLWIDFVPDEKVESWVEQETGSSRGQRNSATRFEVVYNDTGEAIEAVFQELGAPKGPRRPSIGAAATNRSTLSLRQPSYSADPSKTATVASGIHPDRAALVPKTEERRRTSPPPIPTPQRPHADQGKGFGALDDLFSYTATKPKLYFKTVSQDVIDDRLDMIRDLYSDRGISGDPGMKRYTFEKDGGREEWVDNGPEFGHGKRGQDRLAGIGGRGRGGFRGRGGRGGGDGRSYGGDSYRGGGRR